MTLSIVEGGGGGPKQKRNSSADLDPQSADRWHVNKTLRTTGLKKGYLFWVTLDGGKRSNISMLGFWLGSLLGSSSIIFTDPSHLFYIEQLGNGMSFLRGGKSKAINSSYWVQSIPAEKWSFKSCETLKNQSQLEPKGQVIWSQCESKADRLLCLFLNSTWERQSSRAFSLSQHSCSKSQHSKYLHSVEPRAESAVRVTTHLLQCANIL